jgi:hypothetical protein
MALIALSSIALFCACGGRVLGENSGLDSSGVDGAGNPVGGAGVVTVISDAPRAGGNDSYTVSARFDHAIPAHEGACTLQTIGSCTFDPCAPSLVEVAGTGLRDGFPNSGTLKVSGHSFVLAMITPAADGSYAAASDTARAWEGGDMIYFEWIGAGPGQDIFQADAQILNAPPYATLANGSALAGFTSTLARGRDLALAWTMDGSVDVADRIVFTLRAQVPDATSPAHLVQCDFDSAAGNGVVSGDLVALMPDLPAHYDFYSSHRFEVGDTSPGDWQIDYVLASHVRNGSGFVSGIVTLQ